MVTLLRQPNLTVRHAAVVPEDSGYSAAIERAVQRVFPQVVPRHVDDTVEAIMEALVATKEYRVGPRPTLESLVLMREVIRRAVQERRSIPVLVPSAAIKLPIGNPADVAELAALRVLGCLQDRVQQHYAPGLNIRMRLEDLTEYVLSADVPDMRQHVAAYMDTMGGLVNVLGYDHWLRLVPESALADEDTFLSRAVRVTGIMERYLRASQGMTTDQQQMDAASRWPYARDHGLLWPVSPDMRDYFRARYVKLYPGEDPNLHMARYYAAILVRRQMDAVGKDPTFHGSLELYFGLPLPDSPTTSTRLFYRTIPRSQSLYHAAYWHAHGIVRVSEQGQARLAFAHGDEIMLPGQLELTANNISTTIRADYVLE